MISPIVQKMIDYLNSELGNERIEAIVIKNAKKIEHSRRWRDRMWDRIKDNVDESIERILKWYESDRYRDREYKMGIEPREQLLWVLLDVATVYGSDPSEEELEMFENTFTGEIAKIGSYVIQSLYGQGSAIRIDKIENHKYENE
jgi:hypothetical protein